MKIQDPPNDSKENIKLEDILHNTLKDEILKEKIKNLLSVWKDYSYTPSHYIELYEEITEFQEPYNPDEKKVLAIDTKSFWRLDYEWDRDAGLPLLPLTIDYPGDWKFRSIKQLKVKEIPVEFHHLSNESFQGYLEKGLKKQLRNNKWYERYNLLPYDPLQEKVFILGVNFLLKFLASPFLLVYRMVSKEHAKNG